MTNAKMFQLRNSIAKGKNKKELSKQVMTKRNRAPEQTLHEEVITDIGDDRRRKKRYPMNLQVEYKVVKNYLVVGNGTGTSVDMSSNGIAFTTDQMLKVGSYLELSANWPVLLDGACPLKLVVFGKVVRSDERMTALRVDRHEFRTRKAGLTQTTSAPMAMAAGFR